MKTKFLSLAFATMLFASCGGGSNNSESKAEEKADQIIKATQTEIKGDLKGCFEVVDKDYKVKYEKSGLGSWVVTFELKRNEQELPYDRKDVVIYPEAKESSKSMLAGFGIEILDADGNVIEKEAANATPYSWDEMTAAIQLLPNETTTIKYEFYDDISAATGFRITSIVEKNDKRKSEISDLVDAAEKLSKKAEDVTDEDMKKAVEDAEKALEVTEKALDLLF